jgi:hypothetical protein
MGSGLLNVRLRGIGYYSAVDPVDAEEEFAPIKKQWKR